MSDLFFYLNIKLLSANEVYMDFTRCSNECVSDLGMLLLLVVYRSIHIYIYVSIYIYIFA